MMMGGRSNNVPDLVKRNRVLVCSFFVQVTGCWARALSLSDVALKLAAAVDINGKIDPYKGICQLDAT